MATEDQILQLHQREAALQSRINYCCRDIVVWKTYLRIVEEKTGIVVSDFFDNMATGHARRGVPFTVYFSRPFDTSKFSDSRGASDRETTYKYGCKIICNTFDNDGSTLENCMKDRIQEPYENSGVNVFRSWWPCNTGYGHVILSDISSDSQTEYKLSNLPRQVSGNTFRDNYYKLYIDNADSKLKVDIYGKNQFENGRVKYYQTVFVTQWVLKEGASL